MKKLPWGVNRIRNMFTNGDVKTGRNGEWVIAVPVPYRKNFFESIRAAWWVFTGRAEAVIWPYSGELEETVIPRAQEKDLDELFWRLRGAYVRGAEWRQHSGSLELVEKASYDYADKATSALSKKETSHAN